MSKEEIKRITDLLKIFKNEINNCDSSYVFITKSVVKDLADIFNLTEFLLQENQRLKKDYGVDCEQN